MRKYLIIALFALTCVPGFCQSDLVVGSSYQLNLQRQSGNADAFVLHNSLYHSSGQTFSWMTSHPSFGSRGIRFSWTDGIHFFADNQVATAGGIFTPLTRFFISNGGNVGVGTASPEGKLTVSQVGNGWNDGLRINRDVSNYLTLTEDVTDIRLKNWGSGGIKFSTSLLEALTITNNGNIGIGTASPLSKLDIVGPNTGTGPTIRASGGGDLLLNPGGSLFLDGNYSYASGNYIRPVGGNNTQGFFTSGVERIRINADGRIGIGTTSPDEKLSVKGNVHAEEVIIDLAVPAPDYVFEKNYPLTSLDEVQAYIAQHKHLPEVPSAKVMEKDGVKVGEMEMILLKKIEEMTLYMIELKNQNSILEKRVNQLESKN